MSEERDDALHGEVELAPEFLDQLRNCSHAVTIEGLVTEKDGRVTGVLLKNNWGNCPELTEDERKRLDAYDGVPDD